MILQLAWDSDISKASSSLIASVTARREKMDEAIADTLCDDMTEDNASEMKAVSDKCLTTFQSLKAKTDLLLTSWESRPKPETEAQCKEQLKELTEQKAVWTQPKKYETEAVAFNTALRAMTDKTRDFRKASEILQKQRAARSAHAHRAESGGAG
eukprot:6353-Pyramimonas_sp.AAC.1